MDGTLFLRKREDVLKELDSLIETDPEVMPAERRFLLEFDFDSLYPLLSRTKPTGCGQSRLPAVLDNSLQPGGAGWEPVLGVSLPVDAPSSLVLTPPLSLASFRLTWESARRLPSLIVGLPLLCFSSASDNPCNKRLRKPD
jgi:hypothetical protein